MSAIRRRPCRCCGPAAPASRPNSTTPPSASATPSTGCAPRRKLDAPRVLADMLDHLDASGRFALLKLATGELRVGINARLAKQALADAFGLEVEAVEEVWHGLRPPFTELFDWAEGRAEQPAARDVPVFRPFMLAHPLDETSVSLDDYAAEWKWDGIRVQLVHAGGETRLYSRTGDDISRQLPRCRRGLPDARRARRRAAGARRSAGLGPGRRSRRRASTRFSSGSGARTSAPRCSAPIPPSFGSTTSCSTATRICASCRGPSAAARSKRSQRRLDPERFDVSQLIAADSFEALEELRTSARDVAIEGIMLKRRDSAYVAGRRTGLWYKWKRDPLTADCVLMYAQRGSGKRSSYYSDYTFGCWTEDGRAAAGRQGLFRLHRRGTEMARPLGPRPHGPALRPGARGREGTGARSRVRFRSTPARATSPGWRCAFRGSAGSAPTSRPPRPTGSPRCGRWRPDQKKRAGRSLRRPFRPL